MLVVEVAIIVLAIVFTRREPRRAANAPLIGASTLALIGSAGMMSLPASPMTTGAVFVVATSPLWLLALIVLLLVSGARTVRRESRSLGNLLALLAGLGLIGLLAGAITLVLSGGRLAIALGVWLAMAGGWLGFLFVSMVLYQALYSVISARRRPDYLVVLGAGLVDGRVGPLLANRVRRAVEISQGWAKSGSAPPIVMSGGQGDDEPRPEAIAMAEYAATELAVPDELILAEDASTSTEENLRFTADLVAADPHLGPDARGLAVTSNFHVLRAADLARRQGLSLNAVGAPVAWWYWTSAILREFVAQLVNHKWQVVISTAVVSLPLPILLYAVGA